MLDTLSLEPNASMREGQALEPKYYLHRQLDADAVRLKEQNTAAGVQHTINVWNALIPACAVETKVEPWGVRYLHPTKGWKTVGKRRFLIRGVI